MKPTRDSPFYNDIASPMHQYDLPSRISCLNMLWIPLDKLENCFEEPKVIVLRSALTFIDNDLDSTDSHDRCTHCVQLRRSTPRGGARPRLRYLAQRMHDVHIVL